MIKAIYVLGIGAAVLVNIAALTLLVLRYIPFPATARATGIIGICLLFFSLEHFVGLGSLYPLFLPLTALSLFVIWSERAWFSDETFRTSEIVFLCALLYGALWRLSFPEVVEDNDRLADLHRVANYLAGAKLPPVDYWLPYQRFDYYYTFQHYSARTARPAVRLRAGRELHARADHSSRSRARLGLGVPHACPRAPVGETVVDRGARDWRNGDLASPPFRSLTVFPRLFQLRLGRRGLDLQFAPSSACSTAPSRRRLGRPSSQKRRARCVCRSRPSATNMRSAAITRCWRAFCCSSWRSPSWRPSRARRRPSAPGSNSSLVSRCRSRSAECLGVSPPGGVGRCLDAVGPAQLRPWDRALPRGRRRCRVLLLLPFLAGISSRNRLHASRIRVPGSAHAARAVSGRVVAVSGAGACCRAVCGGEFRSPDSWPRCLSRLSSSPNWSTLRTGSTWTISFRFNPVLKWWGWIFTGGVFSISAVAFGE